MATVPQLNPYQCDQCGSANIVAAHVLYQQGTRAYSGTFNSGTSQSYSAQAAAPPSPRGYGRPLILWGFGILFACFWGWAGLSAVLRHLDSHGALESPIGFLALLGIACLAGLFFSIRKIARYNREIYPRLRWNWEHTYICRRCGKVLLIPS
jgi:predicted RNA-binding Zn-ribbon protein involved in translation (DUF1610 family)